MRRLTKTAKTILLIIFLLGFGFALFIFLRNEISSMVDQKTQTAQFSIGDGGLLSGDPCGPNCFYGIQPGISTFEYSKQVINNNLKLSNCIVDSTQFAKYLICENGLSICFDLQKEIVTSINFSPSVLITVNDVVEKFGNPDSIFVYNEKNNNQSTTYFYAYYTSLNMEFSFSPQEGEYYLLTPESYIVNVEYYDDISSDLPKSFLQKWAGFRKYEPDLLT